jgi:hypothetical protein
VVVLACVSALQSHITPSYRANKERSTSAPLHSRCGTQRHWRSPQHKLNYCICTLPLTVHAIRAGERRFFCTHSCAPAHAHTCTHSSARTYTQHAPAAHSRHLHAQLHSSCTAAAHNNAHAHSCTHSCTRTQARSCTHTAATHLHTQLHKHAPTHSCTAAHAPAHKHAPAHTAAHAPANSTAPHLHTLATPLYAHLRTHSYLHSTAAAQLHTHLHTPAQLHTHLHTVLTAQQSRRAMLRYKQLLIDVKGDCFHKRLRREREERPEPVQSRVWVLQAEWPQGV